MASVLATVQVSVPPRENDGEGIYSD